MICIGGDFGSFARQDRQVDYQESVKFGLYVREKKDKMPKKIYTTKPTPSVKLAASVHHKGRQIDR